MVVQTKLIILFAAYDIINLQKRNIIIVALTMQRFKSLDNYWHEGWSLTCNGWQRPKGCHQVNTKES